MLAQGLPQDAAAKAAQAVARFPRSVAALSLLVEAELARAGVPAGLAAYDRWIGTRGLEEAGVVRRLAKAVLEDAVAGKDALLRIEAVKALAEGGEPGAANTLADSTAPADLRTRAELGDARAVERLGQMLAQGYPDKVATLEALGKSRRPAAVPVIVSQLNDPREEVRAAAVDALADAHAEDQAQALRGALNDSSAYVRTRAARALFRLGDFSGLSLLQQMATSDSAYSRLAAAEAMATSPDQSWLTQVRSLAEGGGEPEVRASAARLLAPHDPETAKSVLESLANDPNIAIRELAGRTLGESLAGRDLPSLRRLLSNPDGLTRIHAAGAILKATL
jgi:hypothetical protein